MRTTVALAVALSMAMLAPCSAKENYHEKRVNADTKEAFADVSQSVRREMDHGGKYEFVPPDERAKIDKNFDDMTKLFDQYGTVSAMNQDAKVRLFNDQEVVNSILTKRDRDRVICQNKAPIGSHIQQTSCHTYAQEVEARQETQKQMSDWKIMGCAGTSSGRGTATQPPIACSYRTNGDGGMGARGGH
ncbi:MAG TPA: hypothetical protein VFL30_02045 [Rhodanobacteraceae bacterium]|nr:hypothetical protein [Rhodanobacteraceae bacterium]